MTSAAPLNFREQAELLEYILDGCVSKNGTIAAATYARLEQEDVVKLKALATRLRRMSPHEKAIREMVTGK